jgi:hypothetical protein
MYVQGKAQHVDPPMAAMETRCATSDLDAACGAES